MFVAMQTGAELGIGPAAASRGIYVVNNRPALEGQLALGLIRSAGVTEYMQVGTGTVKGVTDYGYCKFKRKGEPEETVRFTVAEAKKAGLWGKSGPWSKYPDDMLTWKAVSRASKRYFSDVTLGLELNEVARDIPAKAVSRAEARTEDAKVDPLADMLITSDKAKPEAVEALGEAIAEPEAKPEAVGTIEQWLVHAEVVEPEASVTEDTPQMPLEGEKGCVSCGCRVLNSECTECGALAF
jgi:hypothetical protein